MRTVDQTLMSLNKPAVSELPPPPYQGSRDGSWIALAVPSMKDHMTDEGWQIMLALEKGGYVLQGSGLSYGSTDVPFILDYWTMDAPPSVVVVQDKREWEGKTAGPGFDERERFTGVGCLRDRHDIFKVTILKDAQSNPTYHRQSADEIGCHAWIIYYHPRVVAHVAPYVRTDHLIRTYHTVDSKVIPPYTSKERDGCLLSGAVSGAYPLRSRLVHEQRLLPRTTYLPHPGYHRRGTQTPEFLKVLSRYRVAICTSSVYGYALRKIIEATASGCVVITDLPCDELLPEIDANLVRVDQSVSTRRIAEIIRELNAYYDPDKQEDMAQRAQQWYDYRVMGVRLAHQIEHARSHYGK